MPGIAVSIAFAIIFGTLALIQFLKKGPPINNTYLYYSKEDRQKLDKKPLYRQSAICFLLISFNFVIMTVSAIIEKEWVAYCGFVFIGIAIIYAVVSSIVIYKKYKIF